MPIYAYRCATCGHAKDVLQKISDPLLTDCPECGASTFVKQVTAAGFQLKGSGWYVTDFRGDKPVAPKSDSVDPAAVPAKASDEGAGKASTSTSTSTEAAGKNNEKSAQPATSAAKTETTTAAPAAAAPAAPKSSSTP
jgi:putative FmdB family regulatory protein